MTENKTPPTPAGPPQADFAKNIFPCPPNFPPDKWDKKGLGYKRNYYLVVQKQTGGK